MKATTCRKKFYTLLGVLMILCVGYACAATPIKDFMSNKSGNLLQNNIQAPESTMEQPTFPSFLKKDVIIRENTLFLSFDADIKIPAVNEFPVVKIKPERVKLTDIETVLSYISSNYYLGTPLLNDNTFEGLTKQEILSELKNNQWNIEHINELMPNDEVAREDYRDTLERRNKLLTDVYTAAPDMPTIFDLSMLETTNDDLPRIFIYTNNIKRGELFYSAGGAENDERGSSFIIDAMDDESLQPIGTPMFDSLDTLIEFSESLIRNLYPNQSYMINRTEESEFMYRVVYMPSYEGVPYVRTTGYEGSYWPDDSISIYVYKNTNHLRAFERYSPTMVESILNKNVQLLDFHAIERTFENYIASNYSWDGMDIVSQTIVIDDIGLGMKRVPSIDSEGYMVIPAWYFAGHAVSRYDPENCPYTDLDENGERVETFDKEGVIVVINAIDGTILN